MDESSGRELVGFVSFGVGAMGSPVAVSLSGLTLQAAALENLAVAQSLIRKTE
jgi:hypothetical protein